MKSPPPPPPPAKPLKDSAQGRQLSRERIAADLRAFEKSGGHIQVLGTTRWNNGKKTTATAVEEAEENARGQAGEAEASAAS